jgi:hypothetical protein
MTITKRKRDEDIHEIMTADVSQLNYRDKGNY